MRVLGTSLLVLGATAPAIALAIAFPDVTADHPYFDGVTYVQAEGVVEGYPDGTYRPARSVNRAEFTKIIIGARFSRPNIDGCLRQHPNAMHFRDVPAGSWYAPYLCVAVSENIISGYPDGTFRPAGLINFAEAAKILVRSFALTTDERLNNLYGENVWYRASTTRLAQMDAIPPTVDANGHLVSRGEMAEMIYRLQTGRKSVPPVQWRSYSAASGFRFQYPADTFVAFSAEETVTVGPERKVPGIKLVHAAPVEHCDLSGLPDRCTPLTRDITVGFYPVPVAFADLRAQAEAWQTETAVTFAGREGFTFRQSAEGEGNIYTFLPLSEGKSLMIVRSFIDEDVETVYRGAKGFIPRAEQDKIFAEIMATLVMPGAGE